MIAMRLAGVPAASAPTWSATNVTGGAIGEPPRLERCCGLRGRDDDRRGGEFERRLGPGTGEGGQRGLERPGERDPGKRFAEDGLQQRDLAGPQILRLIDERARQAVAVCLRE